MGFFEKMKLSIDDISRELLDRNLLYISHAVEDFINKAEFRAFKRNKDKLFSELLLLAFYNLRSLPYPPIILQATIERLFEMQKADDSTRRLFFASLENRSKQYREGVSADAAKFFSNIIRILEIPDIFYVNSLVYISNFYAALGEMNKDYLKEILADRDIDDSQT